MQEISELVTKCFLFLGTAIVVMAFLMITFALLNYTPEWISNINKIILLKRLIFGFFFLFIILMVSSNPSPKEHRKFIQENYHGIDTNFLDRDIHISNLVFFSLTYYQGNEKKYFLDFGICNNIIDLNSGFLEDTFFQNDENLQSLESLIICFIFIVLGQIFAELWNVQESIFKSKK